MRSTAEERPAVVVRLDELVSETAVGYSDLARELDGREVILEGPVCEGPSGALQLGVSPTGCSHSGGEITITLIDPAPPLALVPPGWWGRLAGTLEYGFLLDADGSATFIRLRGARPSA